MFGDIFKGSGHLDAVRAKMRFARSSAKWGQTCLASLRFSVVNNFEFPFWKASIAHNKLIVMKRLRAANVHRKASILFLSASTFFLSLAGPAFSKAEEYEWVALCLLENSIIAEAKQLNPSHSELYRTEIRSKSVLVSRLTTDGPNLYWRTLDGGSSSKCKITANQIRFSDEIHSDHWNQSVEKLKKEILSARNQREERKNARAKADWLRQQSINADHRELIALFDVVRPYVEECVAGSHLKVRKVSFFYEDNRGRIIFLGRTVDGQESLGFRAHPDGFYPCHETACKALSAGVGYFGSDQGVLDAHCAQ